ncbi:hypothetical protein C8F04DRAFT_1240268 [Mycena alexandri]|uniref:Uncharacterized protein n=1 Tax=Mycena alexandri TaxID=1745969 RepID=A0AAD6S9P7_9AGAR|nr:hypothetical protein C8F04DRAFT_1240268 [Mycena alexandri]
MRINLFTFALVLCLGTAIAYPVARADDMGLSLFDDDLTPGDAVLDVRAPNNDFTNPDDDEEDAILDVRASPKKAAASKKAPAAKKVVSPKAPVAKKVSAPKAPAAKKVASPKAPVAKKVSAPKAPAAKKVASPKAPVAKKVSAPKAPAAKKVASPKAPAAKKVSTPKAPAAKKVASPKAPAAKKVSAPKAPAAKKVASPKAPAAKKVSTPKAPVAKKTSASPTAAKKTTTAPPAAKKKTNTPPVASAKKTTAPAKTTTGKTTTPPGKKTTGKTTGKTTPPGKQTTGKTTGAGCPVKGKRGVTGLTRRTEQNLKIGATSVVVTEVKTAGLNSRIFTTDLGFGGKADVIIKCPTGSKPDFDKEVANTKKVDASGVFPLKLFVDSGVGILDCDETRPLNCLVLTDLTKHGFTELSKAAQAKGKGAGCSTLMDNALGASERNIIQLANKKIGHGDLDTTNTFTNADGSDTIFIDWPDLEVSTVFCVLQLRYRLRFLSRTPTTLAACKHS